MECFKKCSRSIILNYLTLFVFSTENWKRSQKEILFLLTLLDQFLDDLKHKVKDYNFKIRFIGDFSAFSKKIQKKNFIY